MPTSVHIETGKNVPKTWTENEELEATLKFRKLGASTIPAIKLQEFTDKVLSSGLKFRIIATVGSAKGYTHVHLSPTPGNVSFFVAYSKRKTLLDRFAAAYLVNDHFVMGDLLGYPRCCQQFFVDMCRIGYFDTTIPQLMMGDTGLLTQSLRYGGWRLIPFLPCSPRCKEAAKIATKFLDLVDFWWKGLEYNVETKNGLIIVEAGPVRIYSGTVRIREKLSFRGIYAD